MRRPIQTGIRGMTTIPRMARHIRKHFQLRNKSIINSQYLIVKDKKRILPAVAYLEGEDVYSL